MSKYNVGDIFQRADKTTIKVVSVDEPTKTVLIENIGEVNTNAFNSKNSFEVMDDIVFNWKKVWYGKTPSKKVEEPKKYVLLCDGEFILGTYQTKDELIEYLLQSYEGLHNDGCALPASLEEDCFRVYELVPVKHNLKATFKVELED